MVVNLWFLHNLDSPHRACGMELPRTEFQCFRQSNAVRTRAANGVLWLRAELKHLASLLWKCSIWGQGPPEDLWARPHDTEDLDLITKLVALTLFPFTVYTTRIHVVWQSRRHCGSWKTIVSSFHACPVSVQACHSQRSHFPKYLDKPSRYLSRQLALLLRSLTVMLVLPRRKPLHSHIRSNTYSGRWGTPVFCNSIDGFITIIRFGIFGPANCL